MRGLTLLLLLCVSCSSCPGGGLDVEGRYGYRRCAFDDEPKERTWSVGKLRLSSKGRTLRVEGIKSFARLAAFSGPAPGRLGPLADKALRARKLDLALILGGVGDDDTVASETLEVMGSLPHATFVVPGGRDSFERLTALHALLPQEAQDKVVLLSAYRSVQVLGHEFVVIAGAEEGRYAVDNTVCGFSLTDLQAMARDLGPQKPDKLRSLWAWTAPGRGGAYGVGRTSQGIDVGSAIVAEFSQRTGAQGGLYAWPSVRAGLPAVSSGKQRLMVGQEVKDLRMVVPRLGTLPLLRSDGSRLPSGFAVLTVTQHGTRLLGRVEVGMKTHQEVSTAD